MRALHRPEHVERQQTHPRPTLEKRGPMLMRRSVGPGGSSVSPPSQVGNPRLKEEIAGKMGKFALVVAPMSCPGGGRTQEPSIRQGHRQIAPAQALPEVLFE